MRKLWWVVALAIVVPVLAMSQGKFQRLTVSGHTGSIPVTQVDGKNYVEIEALAQLMSAALSFQGTQMTLSWTASNPPAAQEKVGLSKDFLRAAIEEMSTIREWHSALTTGIENQFPMTREVLEPYDVSASKNLRLVQVAATTDADQKAVQLIANEYQKMKQLSDSFLAKRAAVTYIEADALTNDTLNQSVIARRRSLGAMAASGQFTDEAACQ